MTNLGQVDALLLLELADQVGEQMVVKVLASQECVSVRRFHLKKICLHSYYQRL